MKKSLKVLLAIVATGFFGAASPKILTLDRVFDDPNLDGSAPKGVQIVPGGQKITFLKEKASNYEMVDLWEFDVATRKSKMLVDSSDFLKGDEKLSDEEKARRERMRITASGVVEYHWSQSGNALIFPLAGGLFYSKDGKIQRLTDGKFHETDAHVSPHGKYVSYVRDSNLFVIDPATKKEIALTKDGNKLVKYGIAEFIAQEEMDRFDGQWWSGDDRYLAFTKTDESKVEVAKRYEINGDGFEVYDQRYPTTGTRNAEVKLALVDISKPSEIRWLKLNADPTTYLARAKWLPDHQTLAVQLQTRDQKELELRFYDAKTLQPKTILTDKDQYWVNILDDLTFLKKSSQFIWGSERSGFHHLYLYDHSGKLIRVLTQGDWEVRGLVAVDEAEKYAYFVGSRETPIESHLYRVAIATGEVQKITEEPGWHSVEMDDDAKAFIDSFSSPTQPRQVSLHTSDGQLVKYIEENKVIDNHPLAPYMAGFAPSEYGSFKKDGIDFYFRMIKPKGYTPTKKYPVIVDVYGGPHVQQVEKNWRGRQWYWWQTLVNEGFVVFMLDNRGSHGRGHGFETPIYRQVGKVEVEDQKAGIEYLISKGIADPKRIGIFGWSYGGFMSLMCLFKEPGTFHAAASVAPVTDFSLYDTHYTERYMGTPQENAKGYQASDVLQYLDRWNSQMSNKLLMIHGMADDNVLFTNSTRVYKALQDRAIPFEMMA